MRSIGLAALLLIANLLRHVRKSYAQLTLLLIAVARRTRSHFPSLPLLIPSTLSAPSLSLTTTLSPHPPHPSSPPASTPRPLSFNVQGLFLVRQAPHHLQHLPPTKQPYHPLLPPRRPARPPPPPAPPRNHPQQPYLPRQAPHRRGRPQPPVRAHRKRHRVLRRQPPAPPDPPAPEPPPRQYRRHQTVVLVAVAQPPVKAVAPRILTRFLWLPSIFCM